MTIINGKKEANELNVSRYAEIIGNAERGYGCNEWPYRSDQQEREASSSPDYDTRILKKLRKCLTVYFYTDRHFFLVFILFVSNILRTFASRWYKRN